MLACAACGCTRSIKHDPVLSDATALAACVRMFERVTGSVPSEAQGLESLVTRPADLPAEVPWVRIASELPVDPWGRSYGYVPQLAARTQTFQVVTLGADGVPSHDDRTFSFVVGQSEVKDSGDSGNRNPGRLHFDSRD